MYGEIVDISTTSKSTLELSDMDRRKSLFFLFFRLLERELCSKTFFFTVAYYRIISIIMLYLLTKKVKC